MTGPGTRIVRALLAGAVLASMAGAAGAAPRGGAPGPRKRPAAAVVAAAATKTEVAAALVALYSSDPEAAARAADALGANAVPAAHEALLDTLALGLAPSVATSALAALALHPAPPDVPALRRYAGHHNPSVRSAALGALAAYPDAAARAAVVAGLHDATASVRGAAAAAAAKGRVRDAVEPLLQLLALGEEPAARALAAMADVELARRIADQLGKVPDGSLALALGTMLRRPDFGPDAARVEVVRALAKIQDPSAVAALTEYVDSVSKLPARESRTEAEGVIDARLGGK